MSQRSQKQGQSPKVVAGFWIRFFADVIDYAILWAIPFILNFAMEDWFLKLGETDVWIGLLVSIAYFVPLQSRYGNGQSLGYRALGIQVLHLEGSPLTLGQSFLRYIVFAFVGYFSLFTSIVNLAASPFLATFAISIMDALWFLAFIGCYFLIPLHPLKCGLHDLIAGSIVVYRDQFNTETLTNLNSPEKARRAFTIVGIISVVVIGLEFWGFKTLKKEIPFADLLRIQSKLESAGNFTSTSVNYLTYSDKSGIARSIIVQTHIDKPLKSGSKDLKNEYDLAFQAIRDQMKDLSKYNNLRVGLRLGYNLGIRRRNITYFQDEDPKRPGERKDSGSNNDF